MGIFTKKFKILGRSKKMMLISDIIFLILISITIGYYTNNQIQKLNIIPVIEDVIKKISKDGTDKKTEIIIKNPDEIKCSAIKLNSYALYYNKYGDQIGIGPIPPIVGIPTNYWIFFDIQSGENNLKNVNLYTDLEKNTNFTGNKNITFGNFTINSQNQINWSINNIEKNQNIRIAFEVSIIPNEENVGRIMNIIKNTNITAIDELCGKEIITNTENLDTNLKHDKQAKNQGIVQE